MATGEAFQDRIPGNHCFGCGPANAGGLRIKSYWADPEGMGDESVCHYLPQPHQAAGPLAYLNGGIIATLIDCHAVCTAIADTYRREGRAVGEGEPIWCVTASLEIDYRRPTPIDRPVEVRARMVGVAGRKSWLDVRLGSEGGEISAIGKVLAVRVEPGRRSDAPGA